MLDGRVTMYTLAKELDVSTTAVSRAFNPNSKLSAEKRRLILEAAKKMNYEPNNMASRLSQPPIRIGVLIYGYMAVYDNEIIAGIKKAYEELRDFKVSCDLRVIESQTNSPDKALEVLDEFEKAGYEGVLISKLSHDVVGSKIDQMARKGMQVVVFDADMPNTDRLFVSMNNISVATGMVAQLFRMFLRNEQGKIALFKGGDQDELIANFHSRAEENGLQIVSEEEMGFALGDGSQKENTELVCRVLAAHPEVNGIYVSYANCIPVCRYLDENGLGSKIVLITSDIYDEMRFYIENGVIDASIYQNPFAQGHDAFERLYFYIAEKREVPAQLMAHPQVILKSNLNLFENTKNSDERE